MYLYLRRDRQRHCTDGEAGAGIQGTCRQIIDPACRGSGDSGAHHMWNGTEDKIKVKITWIRHGMTQANGEHRYLGKTDEPLSETGIRLLQEKKKEYYKIKKRI